MIHIRKVIDTTYPSFNPIFKRLPYDTALEDFVFYDIETTGFDPEFSRLTMSGKFYYMDGQWILEQFFTESREDEKNVLIEMNNALLYFNKVVTYNGDNFDIPYVINKLGKLDIDANYLKERSLDLYPLTKRLKKKYEFTNVKLKNVEKHAGVKRNYFIHGEELATYYAKAVEGSQEHYDEYVNYNAEDVIYLAQVMATYCEDYFEAPAEQEPSQLTLFD